MLLKRNLLETLTLVCCSGTAACVILHLVSNISPLRGIYLLIYVLCLFCVSIALSFRILKWLLQLNKPVKYTLDGNFKFFSVFLPFLGDLPKGYQSITDCNTGDEFKEYDTNELSVISTVLERHLVSSWYVPYISQEIGFPFACKQILDQMIGKAFQITNKIETKDVYLDFSTIVITHLKEYKKAMKRHENNTANSIETLYKKTHIIFDEDAKISPGDHCTSILRLIFKELVPWELWDTPHSELLIRILSKKLDVFIETTLANPLWLNHKLLTILAGKNQEVTLTKEDEHKASEVLKTEVDTKEPNVPIMEQTQPIIVTENSEGVSSLVEEVSEENLKVVNGHEEMVNSNVTISEPLDIKLSPVLRQRRGRQGNRDVKIYDRVADGTMKTWETDKDLQCISLGQDLLASLDGEITLSRLWEQDVEPEGSPNPPQRRSPQPLWFGEEDMELDLEKPPSSPKLNPADVREVLLKDIQSTVIQAKSKIGDLQVHSLNGISVAASPGDEAAGMMEGLLDFGMAGLKLGLRLTGLGDSPTSDENQELADDKSKSSRQSSTEKTDVVQSDPRGVTIPTSTQKVESVNGSGVPPLQKQQRVSSQDSVAMQSRSRTDETQPLPTGSSSSPELQYEEVTDLSTSIAKLRSLLQARSDESIWWEGAEETQGQTQRHHSSRPVDTATLADEYDMSLDRASSPSQVSTHSTQRLDNIFQRTVTGVFNSLRTAVGEGGSATGWQRDWSYVVTHSENSVGGAVARLVGSRRAFTHVDAALDSLEHLSLPHKKEQPVPEDFEEWCNACGGCWWSAVEVCCAASLCQSYVARRLAALLLHDLIEPLMSSWLDELTSWLKVQIFASFEQMAREDEDQPQANVQLPEINMEETCDAIMGILPGPLQLFGEDTLSSAVKLSVSSFSHKSVNTDVVYRILDIYTLHFKKSAALRNPSFET